MLVNLMSCKKARIRSHLTQFMEAQTMMSGFEPKHLFVLGDNRDNARDSRFWGQVPYDHIVGKVVLSWTPK